jgi:D-lactate dehydrogenase
VKVAVFSTKPYDERFLSRAAEDTEIEFQFLEARLNARSARLAAESEGVCLFVNDTADAEALDALSEQGVKAVALRCAGFNNVDLKHAHDLGICVCRVPAYSPHAVAEHAVGLLLAINRRIHKAFSRVREGNFALEGLMGFDLHGKTAGVIGTGKIGTVAVGLLHGFGMRVLAHDPYPNDTAREKGAEYVELDRLLEESDVVTLHCPLMPETHHLIDWEALQQMKEGAVIINTSRGALLDTKAAIAALKTQRLGALAIDVYEEEGDLFFEDLSDEVIEDDTFARLLTFPNVLVTAHQAFFTEEAMTNIAETTVGNLAAIARDESCNNIVFHESATA